MDELVKPSIVMSAVLHYSGELIQYIKQHEVPDNFPLAMENVSSLYPNIDTNKAIVALDLLL